MTIDARQETLPTYDPYLDDLYDAIEGADSDEYALYGAGLPGSPEPRNEHRLLFVRWRRGHSWLWVSVGRVRFVFDWLANWPKRFAVSTPLGSWVLESTMWRNRRGESD